MICELPNSDGNNALKTQNKKSANVRTSIKGRKIRRVENKPIKIEDEDVEYIGIEKTEETADEQPEMIIESDEPSHEPEKRDKPVITEPDRPIPISEPEPFRTDIISDGVTSDVMTGAKKINEGKGLIYEIAEELYIKEKTISELESLIKPPFHKNFDTERTEELDEQAGKRIKKLVSAAGETDKTPTFLPEPIYEECASPLETKQALLAELIFLVPLVNIAVSVFMVMNPSVNKNIKSMCRAFLIITGIIMVLLGGFLFGKLL